MFKLTHLYCISMIVISVYLPQYPEPIDSEQSLVFDHYNQYLVDKLWWGGASVGVFWQFDPGDKL